MAKTHIKQNDEVVVLSGKEKGKRGKVLELRTAKNRAVVEGLMMVKRHLKKSEEHPDGQIAEREGTIHATNLMLASKYDERMAKKN
ncbi:MAG: 50S ribosomal protein L24 [Opitutaceae bacterium]|jgi:large subunit ribosomal protein L24|nr:50S ribosomal protein L24 [Opitutaceae bacterium]|tara:strand:+ start:776 stop:1033 length:258 start_codon:yes stop_codon:yes gene_type:complete